MRSHWDDIDGIAAEQADKLLLGDCDDGLFEAGLESVLELDREVSKAIIERNRETWDYVARVRKQVRGQYVNLDDVCTACRSKFVRRVQVETAIWGQLAARRCGECLSALHRANMKKAKRAQSWQRDIAQLRQLASDEQEPDQCP